MDYDAKEGQAPPCLASCTLRQRAARPMKRLALSSFLIGGGRDDGYRGATVPSGWGVSARVLRCRGDWRRPASQAVHQGDVP